MKQYPGKLIVLEGNDATGKDTHLLFVEDYLKSQGLPVTVTRTIGGPPSSEAIRNVILEHHTDGLAETTELLLYFAGRYENLRLHVLPALAQGQWVISNRYTYSTIAYQGVARQLGVEQVLYLADLIHAQLWPDLTLLFDQSAQTTVSRLQKQGGQDRIELESLDFFQRVREAYLDQLPGAAEPNDWNQSLFAMPGYQDTQFELVDSERDIATIQVDLQKRLAAFIENHQAGS